MIDAFPTGSLGLTRNVRLLLAARVQNLSAHIPRATGPVLGGWLIHAGWFTAPFLIATVLQALHLYLYRRYFGTLDAAPGRPRVRRSGAPPPWPVRAASDLAQ